MSKKRDQGGQSQDQADGQKQNKQTHAGTDSKGEEKSGMGLDGAMRDQTNDKGERSGAEKGPRATKKSDLKGAPLALRGRL